MALIEVTADLKRTATALERIADSLELLIEFQVNPAALRAERAQQIKMAGPEAVSAPTDEQLWEREQEEARRGQAEFDGKTL